MNMPDKKYIFEYTIDVRDYEIDAEGIVNNANYLHYLEHTRHEFCRQVGFSFAKMREAGIDPVLESLLHVIDLRTDDGIRQRKPEKRRDF